MLRVIETASGSKYTIDEVAKTWKRERGKHSSYIRSDEGSYLTLSIVRDGKDKLLQLVCPPLNPPLFRFITSTAIVKDYYEDDSR